MTSRTSTLSAAHSAAVPWPWWVAVATAAAGWSGFSAVWNQFYGGIPILFDTAWYAHLIHRNALILQNPPAVVFDAIGPAFCATHFSPGLVALSAVSLLAPVGAPTWLALVEGGRQALIALVAATAARRHSPLEAPSWAAAAVVLLAPFQGVLLAGLAYPHFEFWFVPASLGFLLALFRGRIGRGALRAEVTTAHGRELVAQRSLPATAGERLLRPLDASLEFTAPARPPGGFGFRLIAPREARGRLIDGTLLPLETASAHE